MSSIASPSFLRRLLPALLLSTCALLPPVAAAQSTMVRLHTTLGPIDFRLLDAEAPRTVANFLAYVRSGAYSETIVHRSARSQATGLPFVIQGGGYVWPAAAPQPVRLTTLPPVANEFAPDRSNLRGTVAMARLGGQPDSATSQWFINMAANTALDGVDGGFTVFARVTAPGMVVAERIAALPRLNASSVQSALNEVPILSLPVTMETWRAKSVFVGQVTEFPPLAQQSETDRVFNYLEAAYPEYLLQSHGEQGSALGYVYRYYAASNAYVGIKDGRIDYLLPALSSEIQFLAPVADVLAQAAAAGY